MRVLAAIGTVGAVLLILEGISWAVAGLAGRVFSARTPVRKQFLAEQSRMLRRMIGDETRRERIHPIVGWVYRANYVNEFNHLNDQGIRARQLYAEEPSPNVKRVAAFGDSYVYCNEVVDDEAWPAQMEAQFRAEVLNYGVGGYGVDQAFLRFQEEGSRFKPEIVIIGFTSMMTARAVSRYRRFQDPADGPWFKPRFAIDGNALRFIPPPVASRDDAERLLANPEAVAEFGQNDFWYNPAVFEHSAYSWSATYRLFSTFWFRSKRTWFQRDRIYAKHLLNPESESFTVVTMIIRDFALAIRAIGAEPVVLMLPSRSDMELFANRGRATYQSLSTRIKELGIPIVDPASALSSAAPSRDDLFAEFGHYSTLGNAIVARQVADALHLVPRL